MKNKKAWLRILESFLAVVMVLGAVLVIMSKQQVQEDLSEEIYETQSKIIEVISKNQTLRDYVITGDKEKIDITLRSMLPQTFAFATNICEVETSCNTEETPHDKPVHAREVLITTNIKTYAPKKLRFFIWIKD